MSLLRRSPHTERALTLPRPRWRGISHLMAAIVAVPAAVWLASLAPAGAPRVSVGIFGGTIATMFALSALTHRRTWSEGATEALFRLDHTGIYLAIAGTATPIAVLGLEGWTQGVLLWGAWISAGIGIVVEWLPFAAPRGFTNTVFLTMGWLPLLLIPWLWANTGWHTILWLGIGGFFYTVGAAIVGLRRPDPNPNVFGYHEIWHLLVIAAVAAHYVMVAGTLLPNAGA